jgi:outer membrane protein OmpA-like peptidoglycan-associated protein
MIRPQRPLLYVVVPALLFALLGSYAQAGIGDRLKKKVQQKVEEKADEAVDKAVDPDEGAAEGAETAGSPDAPATSEGSTGAGPAGAVAKVSAVSTKFDYVPGDSVLFADDFTQDELGEFPARWKLTLGTFEVAEMEGERWLRCASDDGRIRMKLPAMTALPEFWTLEFDFHCADPEASSFLTVIGLTPREETAWEATFPHSGNALAFRAGEVFSTTHMESGSAHGRHHFMLMARGKAIKAYLDAQRMANVPEISDASGMPAAFEVRLWSPAHPMIANVRFAEGCRPAADLLAGGKLVTYGIHFASGSDVVEPESAPILRQIAAYLEKNPAVKLGITGHTDNVGRPESNLDLSKRRASAVARILAEEFKIAADRFLPDGKGESEAVASNASAEGRAMNRRVEFRKV